MFKLQDHEPTINTKLKNLANIQNSLNTVIKELNKEGVEVEVGLVEVNHHHGVSAASSVRYTTVNIKVLAKPDTFLD